MNISNYFYWEFLYLNGFDFAISWAIEQFNICAEFPEPSYRFNIACRVVSHAEIADGLYIWSSHSRRIASRIDGNTVPTDISVLTFRGNGLPARWPLEWPSRSSICWEMTQSGSRRAVSSRFSRTWNPRWCIPLGSLLTRAPMGGGQGPLVVLRR